MPETNNTGRQGMERLASMPLECLEAEIGELAAHIHAATCRWLVLVAELDRREGWAEWGCRSCADWLSLRCGVAPGAAREQVRVARHLGTLPRTWVGSESSAGAAGRLRSDAQTAESSRQGPSGCARAQRSCVATTAPGAVVVWPETAAARSGGDRFSLDIAVEALLARDGPLGVSGPAPA